MTTRANSGQSLSWRGAPKEVAPVTDSWIAEVGKTTDTYLRGHRVALTYHFLARDLDWHINGPESVWACLNGERPVGISNATWFNFSTWATVTINRDLGLGQTPAGINRLLRSPVRRPLTPLLFHLTAADGQRVSRALSWAQRLVFLSTTYIWLARRWRAPGDDTESLKKATYEKIVDRAGWGKELLGKKRHLEVIWAAFDAYEQAARTNRELERECPNQERRTQLSTYAARCILQGNVLITAVEQDVVDEAVGEAINHIPELIGSGVVNRAALAGDRYFGIRRELTGFDLPFQISPALKALKSSWARFMTSQILVLLLPTETLRLGQDIPPLAVTDSFFPSQLGNLERLPHDNGPTSTTETEDSQDRRARNNALYQLVSGFDRTTADGRRSGARDWRDYSDRMNWAVNMLRSRQQDLSVYWCPYTEQDQRRIVAGKLPLHGGDPTNYEVLAPLDGFRTEPNGESQ